MSEYPPRVKIEHATGFPAGYVRTDVKNGKKIRVYNIQAEFTLTNPKPYVSKNDNYGNSWIYHAVDETGEKVSIIINNNYTTGKPLDEKKKIHQKFEKMLTIPPDFDGKVVVKLKKSASATINGRWEEAEVSLFGNNENKSNNDLLDDFVEEKEDDNWRTEYEETIKIFRKFLTIHYQKNMDNPQKMIDRKEDFIQIITTKQDTERLGNKFGVTIEPLPREYAEIIFDEFFKR